MIAQVKGNLLRIREAQPLTQGSVGLTLELELSEEWTGLAVTALFSAGHLTRDVAVSGESLTIPWELLAEADHKLLLSIYGALPNRGTVLTTNIASLGPIEASLQPSGHEPDAPSPSRADQIQAMAEQALSVAQELRRDADSGAFDGRDGSSPSARVTKSGRTATIEITDQNGTTTATVQDCDIDREEFDQQSQQVLSLQSAVAALQAERYKGFAADSASGAVASFPDGADNIPVKDLTVAIEPAQSGTGVPAPDNVRPISGRTGANITVSPTADAEDGTTYAIAFPAAAGTVYGGTLDVTTGKLTVSKAYALLDDPDSWVSATGTVTYIYSTPFQNREIYADSYTGLQCTIAPTIRSGSYTVRWQGATTYKVGINDANGITSLTDIKTLAARGDIAIVYDIPPIVYDLTPIEVTTLLGANNLWADCGDSTVEYRADTTLYVDKKIAALAAAMN